MGGRLLFPLLLHHLQLSCLLPSLASPSLLSDREAPCLGLCLPSHCPPTCFTICSFPARIRQQIYFCFLYPSCVHWSDFALLCCASATTGRDVPPEAEVARRSPRSLFRLCSHTAEGRGGSSTPRGCSPPPIPAAGSIASYSYHHGGHHSGFKVGLETVQNTHGLQVIVGASWDCWLLHGPTTGLGVPHQPSCSPASSHSFSVVLSCRRHAHTSTSPHRSSHFSLVLCQIRPGKRN